MHSRDNRQIHGCICDAIKSVIFKQLLTLMQFQKILNLGGKEGEETRSERIASGTKSRAKDQS